MPEKEKQKKDPQAYDTYALAEDKRRDKKTKAARPGDKNVERMRNWSIENKL